MRVVATILILALGGCSDDNNGPATGTERGPCYPNSTCNPGLVCLSSLCVRATDGAVLDGGGDGPRGDGQKTPDGPVVRDDIRPTGGTVTTVAGTGQPGSKDGPGTAAQLSSPTGLAVEGETLYVADRDNHCIRVVDLKVGTVSTLAGDGQPGWVDGLAATAKFNAPTGLVLDKKGALYVADAGNHRIRKITLATGQVTTFAGSGKAASVAGSLLTASFNSPRGVAIDPWGLIYVTDHLGNYIRRIASGQVTGTTTNYMLSGPAGLTVDPQGTVLIAEVHKHRIASYLTSVGSVAGSTVKGFADGDSKFAKFNGPAGVAIDAVGDLFVADTGNHAVRKVSKGNVVTLCGGKVGFADGPLSGARFHLPYGIAVDAKGRIFIADTGNHRVRMITP